MLILEDVWYKDIIKGITLKIGQGITALIGPNGAGKTTLLKIITGVLKPDKGRVIRPKKVGASWQNPYYSFYKPTVRSEVEFALKLAKKNIDVDEYLEEIGFKHLANQSPFRLSMGEARILSINLALVWDPEILLIDEPTSGLDIFEKKKLAQKLREIKIPVIIASHDIDFVIEVSDKVVVMSNGTIIAHGNVFDVFNDKVLRKIGFPKPLAIKLYEITGIKVRNIEELLSKIK